MWWLWACADTGSVARAAYLQALDSGACETVLDTSLRDDCYLALAAKSEGVGCDQVRDDKLRDECWFLAAEHGRAPALCAKAGQFRDDCGLHVLSRVFVAGLTETDATVAIASAGFAADDMRPWAAWTRDALSRQDRLDRGWCSTLSAADRVEACENTALAVLDDALNRARDQRKFDCATGVPAPPFPVHWVADPALDARFAARNDLCAPRAAPR